MTRHHSKLQDPWLGAFPPGAWAPPQAAAYGALSKVACACCAPRRRSAGRRDQRVLVREATLRDVADVISGTTRLRIFLVAQRVARQRLTAVLDLADPDGALKRIESLVPVRVVRLAPNLVSIVWA